MRLEKIFESRKKGSSRKLSKQQFFDILNENNSPLEDSKYHIGDTFYRNHDADKDVWTIEKIIKKFNVPGIIEPQLYEITSPITGAPWNLVYKTVSEQELDEKFTPIHVDKNEEPETTGEEFNECFLRENKAEVCEEDQKILNTNYFKKGDHYCFWANTKNPSYFYIDHMYIDSHSMRVFCHIIYEDMPNVPRGKLKTNRTGITETDVSLNGMEEMRQRGDLTKEDAFEPTNDGSEWDE